MKTRLLTQMLLMLILMKFLWNKPSFESIVTKVYKCGNKHKKKTRKKNFFLSRLTNKTVFFCIRKVRQSSWTHTWISCVSVTIKYKSIPIILVIHEIVVLWRKPNSCTSTSRKNWVGILVQGISLEFVFHSFDIKFVDQRAF